MNVRLLAAAALLLASCAPPPPPPKAPEKAPPEPAAEEWYPQVTADLAALNRKAGAEYRAGRRKEAGRLVVEGQALAARLLAKPHATLAAMEAADDLDLLYARLLQDEHNLGWARLVLQKSVARWTNWRPVTPESEQRRKQALAGIAAIDRAIAAQ